MVLIRENNFKVLPIYFIFNLNFYTDIQRFGFTAIFRCSGMRIMIKYANFITTCILAEIIG